MNFPPILLVVISVIFRPITRHRRNTSSRPPQSLLLNYLERWVRVLELRSWSIRSPQRVQEVILLLGILILLLSLTRRLMVNTKRIMFRSRLDLLLRGSVPRLSLEKLVGLRLISYRLIILLARLGVRMVVRVDLYLMFRSRFRRSRILLLRIV